MYQNIVTPRFVTCINHDIDSGNIKEYTWDREKLHVEGYLMDDLLMLQNVFEGKIISPSIYPLIYENKTHSNEISLRSLEFYREVDANPDLYKMLSSEEKIYFLIGIRDLFVASCRKLLSKEEKSLLMRIVDLIDPNDPSIAIKKIKNVDVTPYPTASHKVVRFLDQKSETIADEFFIRNELNLLLGFVDPQDLSYHNFENIINLDSIFADSPCEFTISNVEKHPTCEVYGFEMTDKAKILLSLNNYGLYSQPLNKLSRGGERFIFLSETLSNQLTATIKTGITYKKLITPKFRFVNYVFRYNKFSPGDHKFTSHYDTPYYDPSRKHYSKYTLLLYLTSGTADPVLSFNNGNVKIDTIETKGEVRGIIFDQKYEHEGKCFVNGDKIFLRSELIFEYGSKDGLTFDERVSRQFNIACYMTKQSVFNQELERYASDCFNQVAQARLNLSKSQITKDYLIYKEYYDIPFITNGYDYWFAKGISLQNAGVLAMLDHFNCTFDSGVAFNKLTYNQVITLDVQNISEIFKYLTEGHNKANKAKKANKTKKGSKKKTSEMEIEKPKNMQEEEVKIEKTEMEVEDWNEFKHFYVRGIQYQEDEDETHKDEDYINNEENGSMSCSEDENGNEDHKSLREEIKQLGKNNILQGSRNRNAQNNDSSSDNEDEKEEDDEDEEEELSQYNENCCPYHCQDMFDATESHEVKEYLRERQKEQREKLKDLQKQFSIFIFDKQVTVKTDKIKITDNSIVFKDTIPAINFAATRCWDEGDQPEDFVKSESKPIRAYNSIPPINYRVYDEGYHLKIELFSSRFVRKCEDVIEEYEIINKDEDEEDEDEEENEDDDEGDQENNSNEDSD